MQTKTIVGIVVVIAVLVAAYYFWPKMASAPEAQTSQESATASQSSNTEEENELNPSQANRDPMMSGVWKSDQDAKFTREFNSDGTIIDRYEGDATAGVNGEWTVVDTSKETTIGFAPATSLAGMTVIRVEWEGGVETTFFSVNALTEKTLRITDLSGRGAVTTFTKVN